MNMKLNDRFADGSGSSSRTLTLVMFGYNHEALCALAEADTEFCVIVVEERSLYEKKGLEKRSADPRIRSVLSRWEWCEYQNNSDAAVECIRELLKDTHVDGIVPGLEYAVGAANAAARAVGLPHAGEDAPLRDKIAFRRRVGGVQWTEIKSESDIFEPPCVIKPANRQASLGVSIIRSSEEVSSAWTHTSTAREPRQEAGRPWDTRYICESLLEGDESSAECLVVDGDVVFLNITSKETSGAVELGHEVGQHNPGVEEAMRDLVSKLGVQTALLHAEFKGTTPIECAGRPPGDRIMLLIDRAWGVNLYEQWARAMCQYAVSVPQQPSSSAAIRFIHAPRGLVRSVEDPTGHCVITVEPNTWVSEPACSWDRVGFVEADTHADAVRHASQVRFKMANDVVLYLNHRRTAAEWTPAFEASDGAVLLTDKEVRPAGIVETVQLDTNDHDAVIAAVDELSSRYDIRGVVTFSDRDVETVSLLADKLDLPAPSQTAALKARNKFEMRKAVQSIAPQMVPSFSFIEPGDNAQSVMEGAGITVPCVVKPVDASGSRGFSLCHTAEEVSAAVSRWGGPMVVEELLTGSEHSAEGYVYEGEVHLIGVTDKTTTPEFRLEIGQVFPSAVEGIQDAVKPLLQATIKALGINNCAFHMEFFFDARTSTVKLVEIAARPGGDYIASHLVPQVTGVSFARDLVRIATGQRPSFAVPRDGYVAATFKLHTEKEGVLKSMGQLPTAPIVVESQQHVHVGDLIRQPPADTLSSILAEVVVVAASRREIEAFESRLREVEVVVE
ncbi:ATP-grasp domain-containing protein [Corynebacterium aurimucosum]|nr:ATP-grasp domain-containing protein [Corynebacterium guaraldiae]